MADKYRVTFKAIDGWGSISVEGIVDAEGIIPALKEAMVVLNEQIGVTEAIKFEPVKVEKIN